MSSSENASAYPVCNGVVSLRRAPLSVLKRYKREAKVQSQGGSAIREN